MFIFFGKQKQLIAADCRVSVFIVYVTHEALYSVCARCIIEYVCLLQTEGGWVFICCARALLNRIVDTCQLPHQKEQAATPRFRSVEERNR